MPSLVLGGLAIGSQVWAATQQAGLSRKQRDQAALLKRRDTTPAAFTEALDLSRQQAEARMPGTSVQENRIGQQTATTSQAAVRAGATASQVQAALVGADMRGQSAMADLGRRSQEYRDRARTNLSGMLLRKGDIQRADQEAFDREKAALLEGAEQNSFGATQSVANGVAGAANIFMSAQLGGLGRAGANGAIDAMNPSQVALGPSGLGSLPTTLPTAGARSYTALGPAPRQPLPYKFNRR